MGTNTASAALCMPESGRTADEAALVSRTATERPASEVEPREVAWFIRAWPIVVFLHLAGNPGYLRELGGVALVQVLWLAAAVGLACTPLRAGSSRVGLQPLRTVPLVFVLHAAVYVMKAPWVGNHELLMLLVELAGTVAVVSRRSRWQTDWAIASRALLVIAYSAFAFSKLNTDFFDRAVSCAVVFGDELGLPVQSSASLGSAVIGLTAATEVLIALLLWFPRTRRVAAIIGTVFHWILALEPVGHVFDFSSVLFVLFGLCIPGFEKTMRSMLAASRLSVRSLLGAAMVIIAGQTLVTVNQWTFWTVAWPVWIVLSVGWLGAVLTHVRGDRVTSMDQAEVTAVNSRCLNYRSVAWWMMVVLASLNAFTPYIGLKSATSFNMYSNLRVTPGPSNHLVIPDAFAVIDYPKSSVQIDRDDPSALDAADAATRVPDVNLSGWDNASLLDRLVVTRSVSADGPQQCRRALGPFL